MSSMFLAMLIKPFFLLACLVIGYPITNYVRRKMKRGPLRDFLLTELDPKKAATKRKASAD